MHDFHTGEPVRILKHGVEAELTVFSQQGEFVYVFDKRNRAFQFHVSNVFPLTRLHSDTHERDTSAARQDE